MEAQLVRLYLRLLSWLPPGFRDEFTEEMGQVAAARMGEAGRRGGRALSWAFMDEVRALPQLLLYAHRRERQVYPMEILGTNTPANKRESWGAALAATLPLVAFLCVCVIDAIVRRFMGAGGGAALIRLLWAAALRIAAIPIQKQLTVHRPSCPSLGSVLR